MNREDIIRMAREAGLHLPYWDDDQDPKKDPPRWTMVSPLPPLLERFAALVEAHVNAKEKERQRYDIHSCGPDCDRYICVAVRKAREEEREACAKVCDEDQSQAGEWTADAHVGGYFAARIRARGQA